MWGENYQLAFTNFYIFDAKKSQRVNMNHIVLTLKGTKVSRSTSMYIAYDGFKSQVLDFARQNVQTAVAQLSHNEA